jgi:hypothetical protein
MARNSWEGGATAIGRCAIHSRWGRFLLGLCLLAPGFAHGQQLGQVTLAKGVILGDYSAPRIAMAGDADGDGRADFLGYYPPDGGIVDLMRTSALGKPCSMVQARKGALDSGLAAACGRFTDDPGASVLVVLPDGAVRVVRSLTPDATSFARDNLAAVLTPAQLPKPPVQSAVGDFDGDGEVDVLLGGAGGRLLLLRSARWKDGSPRFAPHPVSETLPQLRRLTSGDLRGDGKAEVVWSEWRGAVYRAALELRSDGAHLDSRRRIAVASPDDGLVAGRFRGEQSADVIVGQRLLPGGDAAGALQLPYLPTAAKAKTDYAWIAADFDGDGRDDLMRCQRSGDRFDGDHVYLHYAVTGDSPEGAPLADADNDGLLNGWETGKAKPGGLDLVALGCSPAHRDLIVELQRMEDVPEDKLRAEMDRVVGYFASLPIDNADGAQGLALHVLHREPIPLTDKDKPWWELGDKYHPATHRGVTHWMVVSNAGGGQSGETADRGGCGFHGFYATFIHEFGHQIGLDHTGHWGPAWCPTYPSLMNYAYNYQLNGKGEDIGYSDGRLAAVVLNERHLSERLPLPPDKVAFLSGPPYHYRLKPTPDGKGALIDWNWNGLFGEGNVAADINYGYSTTGGLRHTLGKTYTAPALVSHGDGSQARLLLFAGALLEGAPVPPADAGAKQPSLSLDQPGRLYVRLWQGKDPATDGPKWSEEITVEPKEVTGDPSATCFEGATWVAYPTTTGITIRRVTLGGDGRPVIGATVRVPDSLGTQPTLTPFAGRIALLLWRDAKTPIGCRFLSLEGEALAPQPEQGLGFTSTVPVGAVAGQQQPGEGPTLWIGLMQDQEGRFPGRWQVRRFVLEKSGALRQVGLEWIGGEQGGERGSSRVVLLWERDHGFEPEGQLYFFGCGLFGESSPWSCHYVATRIADGTVNGGWLTRRYYDEWTQSRSAPGVCFLGGDIALAVRWFGNVHGTENDNLFVAFYGRGIEAEPMGDFDDLRLICDYGLGRSIPNVTE